MKKIYIILMASFGSLAIQFLPFVVQNSFAKKREHHCGPECKEKQKYEAWQNSQYASDPGLTTKEMEFIEELCKSKADLDSNSALSDLCPI